MDMEELFKKIQEGNSMYKINHSLMLTSILTLSCRNQVYLEHIIEELYPNEKERTKICDKLEEDIQKHSMDQLALLISLSDSEKKE